MKILFFAVALFVGISAFAQEFPTNGFIRVYDLEGKKVAKGKIQSTSDSTLQLRKGLQIDPRNIGFVKTKRSTGNNILIGSLAGALISGASFAASADPDAMFYNHTAAEGFLGGAVVGAPFGALIGWISSAFKKSRTIIFNGDLQKWKKYNASPPTENY